MWVISLLSFSALCLPLPVSMNPSTLPDSVFTRSQCPEGNYFLQTTSSPNMGWCFGLHRTPLYDGRPNQCLDYEPDAESNGRQWVGTPYYFTNLAVALKTEFHSDDEEQNFYTGITWDSNGTLQWNQTSFAFVGDYASDLEKPRGKRFAFLVYNEDRAVYSALDVPPKEKVIVICQAYMNPNSTSSSKQSPNNKSNNKDESAKRRRKKLTTEEDDTQTIIFLVFGLVLSLILTFSAFIRLLIQKNILCAAKK